MPYLLLLLAKSIAWGTRNPTAQAPSKNRCGAASLLTPERIVWCAAVATASHEALQPVGTLIMKCFRIVHLTVLRIEPAFGWNTSKTLDLYERALDRKGLTIEGGSRSVWKAPAFASSSFEPPSDCHLGDMLSAHHWMVMAVSFWSTDVALT